MGSSLIDIIARAFEAARQMGLEPGEERDVARAVLMARDPTLTLGVARVLVDQLHPIVAAAA